MDVDNIFEHYLRIDKPLKKIVLNDVVYYEIYSNNFSYLVFNINLNDVKIGEAFLSKYTRDSYFQIPIFYKKYINDVDEAEVGKIIAISDIEIAALYKVHILKNFIRKEKLDSII